MQVSAISSNIYGTSDYSQTGYINSRGYDAEMLLYTYTSATDLSERSLYYNINQWKHFCHKQIAKGNLDFII